MGEIQKYPDHSDGNVYTGITTKMGEIKVTRTEDKTIAIPRETSPGEAAAILLDLEQAEEEAVQVHEMIEAFLFDGAVAFMWAMAERYGWARATPTPGMFGPEPPHMVSIQISCDETMQIMWGRFKLPQIDGYLNTSATRDNKGRLVFEIGGKVKKKHEKEIAALANLTRKIVKERSIYKGKAFKLACDNYGNIDDDNAPSFIRLLDAKEEELLFKDDLQTQVETNLFTPINHTQECRNLQIPLKRGILLEGPYGTGKTMAAYITARKCEANGWTFIMLDKVAGLAAALDLAKLYQPAVIFAEDIDRVVAGEDRTVSIDDVLNTIDGIGAKDTEIITCLTTNHVEQINKAMLRPGRLDAIISVTPPDAKTAMALVHLYARELLSPDADLEEAGKELDGQIPAVIREAVERAKLYALTRVGGDITKLVLEGSDVAAAAKGMKAHLKLLQPDEEKELSPAHKLGECMVNALGGEGSNAYLQTVAEAMEQLREELCG